MKKFLALSAVFLIILTGCNQSGSPKETAQENNSDTAVNEDLVNQIPEDFEGVWLRTGTYTNGVFVGDSPATLTLNKDNYTSVGASCSNTGTISNPKENELVFTLDTSNCPNAAIGSSYTSTYSVEYNEKKGKETMTITTGDVLETYDRQS